MRMVGAGRERIAGAEGLLREPAVGGVRPMEGPADRNSLTKKSGVHPREKQRWMPVHHSIRTRRSRLARRMNSDPPRFPDMTRSGRSYAMRRSPFARHVARRTGFA